MFYGIPVSEVDNMRGAIQTIARIFDNDAIARTCSSPFGGI